MNVTPDKRMVFFEREKELLALIRSSFLATFHPLLGSYTSVGDKFTNTGRLNNIFTLIRRVQLLILKIWKILTVLEPPYPSLVHHCLPNLLSSLF